MERKIENKLWDIACTLQGSIDTSEYKQIILGLIFLKYISDKFEIKYKELVIQGDGLEDNKDVYIAENIFFVPKDARWSYILENANKEEIGQIIDNAMKSIEKTGKSVDTQFLIDDALVSQRGYGKIKLKAETLSSVRAILSEKGKIWVSVSHLKDLKEKVGDQMIKVGDAPDVYKSSPYDFDIILKTSREKDLISGSYKYFVEVEKDTYGIVGNGKKIDITSESFSKGNIITKSINNFIEDEEKSDKEVGSNFDELDDSIADGMSESEETKILAYDTYMEEFKKIYISLDKEKQSLAKDIINKYASDGKVTSIKKISDLEKVVTELKEL